MGRKWSGTRNGEEVKGKWGGSEGEIGRKWSGTGSGVQW